MTRTLSPGMWNASASSSRTANGRCEPVHTVSLSPVHPATAARVSRGTWAMYSTVYVRSSLTSADAIASSTEPAALVVPRSPLSVFFLRNAKRVSFEGWPATSFHVALIAAASRAAAAIKATWNEVAGQPSNETLFAFLRKNTESGERGTTSAAGSVDEAMASADVKLERTYTVEYIAHVPLETRAAVAGWTGDKLTVWTGSQRPFAVRDELADAFHIPGDKVRVIVPDTGSGYGGKHAGDAAVEAARLAKAAGKPVKVTWSREEELTWAYFRPAGVLDVKSGARRDGTLTAWEFHNYNSGPAAIGTPYAVANQRIQFHPVPSPLRQGSYRGLAATANHFARETHMDEVAHALSLDPLAFRLKNITDARLKAVFEAAAAKFEWGKHKSTKERRFGIAGGTDKGGYLATCAEVEIDGKTRRVRIRRVVAAFECGAVVNPNGLHNQIEGAIVQAIGGAMFEAVRFENGRILNARLSQYRVPRFADAPEIEIVVLNRKDLPSAGAGETPIVGLAPAVGNAIFAATGVRLRGLPLVPQGIPPAVS